MTKKKNSDFRTSFYIPATQKLALHLPNERIIVKNHCGTMQCTALKRRELFQDVLFCRDYYEKVVTIFARQIQPEYYVENRSVSIEGIYLEHFSALTKVRYQFNYTITSTLCSESFFFKNLKISNMMLPLLLHIGAS